MGLSLPLAMILTTCTISILRNHKKCTWMFMISKIDSVLQGLTHWGWVMHICISILTTIGSDNDLSLGWCQAIIQTNTGILLIECLGTDFRCLFYSWQTRKYIMENELPFILLVSLQTVCGHHFPMSYYESICQHYALKELAYLWVTNILVT